MDERSPEDKRVSYSILEPPQKGDKLCLNGSVHLRMRLHPESDIEVLHLTIEKVSPVRGYAHLVRLHLADAPAHGAELIVQLPG